MVLQSIRENEPRTRATGYHVLLREGLSRFWTEYYLIQLGIAFTAMVIFMPQGLLGFWKRRLKR